MLFRIARPDSRKVRLLRSNVSLGAFDDLSSRTAFFSQLSMFSASAAPAATLNSARAYAVSHRRPSLFSQLSTLSASAAPAATLNSARAYAVSHRRLSPIGFGCDATPGGPRLAAAGGPPHPPRKCDTFPGKVTAGAFADAAGGNLDTKP